MHTLSKLVAPWFDYFCTNVNSFVCTSSVSDDKGGEINVLAAKILEATELMMPALVVGAIFALGCTVSFYLFLTMAATTLVVGATTFIKKKTKVKVL